MTSSEGSDVHFENGDELFAELKAAADRVLAQTPTRAQIEAQIADNDAKIAALVRQGVPIDAGSLAGVRLGELCEHLLGDMDDPRRLAFEARLQARYAELIGVAEAQAASARLLHGVDLSALQRGNGGVGRPQQP